MNDTPAIDRKNESAERWITRALTAIAGVACLILATQVQSNTVRVTRTEEQITGLQKTLESVKATVEYSRNIDSEILDRVSRIEGELKAGNDDAR